MLPHTRIFRRFSPPHRTAPCGSPRSSRPSSASPASALAVPRPRPIFRHTHAQMATFRPRHGVSLIRGNTNGHHDLPGLSLPIAQFTLQNLSGGPLRQRVDKCDAGRRLVGSKPRPAVPDQLALRKAYPVPNDNERLDRLSVDLVRNPNHGTFRDRGMCIDRLLHLRRINVGSAPNDAVALTADDV